MRVLLIVLSSMLLITGCHNDTHINLFDYSHKPAMQFLNEENIEEQMLDIIGR